MSEQKDPTLDDLLAKAHSKWCLTMRSAREITDGFYWGWNPCLLFIKNS